jgi:uncharacterized membrane protein YvlD (DUF360 family)
MMEMTIIQESSLFGSLIRIVLNGLAMFAIAYVLKTVDFKSFKDALLAALIMAVFNVTIAPILEFFTSPIRLITFGLFNIVIDAALLYGVAYLLKLQQFPIWKTYSNCMSKETAILLKRAFMDRKTKALKKLRKHSQSLAFVPKPFHNF